MKILYDIFLIFVFTLFTASCMKKEVDNNDVGSLYEGKDLSEVTSFSLKNEKGIKALPQNIDKLTHLQEIKIEETGIRTLPDALKNLTYLTRLSIGYLWKPLHPPPELNSECLYKFQPGFHSIDRCILKYCY